MSRRSQSSLWILKLVCCPFVVSAVLASMATVGWGQDYLNLTNSEPESKPTTLADRFLSLKDRLSPKKSQPAPSTERSTSRRKRPQTPRYGSMANSPASASSTPSASNKAPTTSPRTMSRQQALSPPQAARPTTKVLLPDTVLFSRGNSSQPRILERETKQLTRATNLPQVAKTTNQPAPQRVARKSPSTSRANELDAALADLLKPQAVPRSQQTAVKSPTATAKSSPPANTATAENIFDLRKALLDEGEQTIDEETSAAVADNATQAAMKNAAAQANLPEPVEAKPTAKKQAKLAVESPAIDPVVAAPEPPRQVISIATPPKKAITPALVQPEPSSDPFEGAAKQVFSQPQSASNPMRSFELATQPDESVQTIAKPQRGMLQTTQQPVIVSHVEGPRSILVGHEATYQVSLENTSNTPATKLSAQITVPEWAELVDAMSTSGVVERNSQGADAGALEWKISELAPRSSQALRLRLIPRSGRPLQLGVRWTQAPVQAQATVEVREPKLDIAISGPQEVRYGQPQRYRLTLRNPGTGLTEQVSLRLIPPGGTEQSATTQVIGDLKPGEVKDIDLELTAREAGELLIQADATSVGGLKAETTKSVLCRKPELQVDWRGPDKKYAGTEAAYFFRIRNPGTAATEPVEVSVKLPAGAEFVTASEGYSINTKTGVVSWQMAALDVNEEQFAQLRCKIARPGVNNFELNAKTADVDLSDSKTFHTDVVALADLKLEVRDPEGPLPLGESVVYEIRVRNRGTTDAENINIVGLFSEGIDPTTVEGAQFSLRDGRVSFHPINSLPAGREVVLKIHAKANQVGTHIFRTEVSCPKLDIKLAAEETTRFFEDEHSWGEGETPYTAERNATMKR